MIKERYLMQGVVLKSCGCEILGIHPGDIVIGTLAKKVICGGNTRIITVIQVESTPTQLLEYEVDPNTIEPVAVKPLKTPNYMYPFVCPNCKGTDIYTYIRQEYSYPKRRYCPVCGQHIDLSEYEIDWAAEFDKEIGVKK